MALLLPIEAAAQGNVITRARAASADGRRAEGIALLQAHLQTSPRDVDARLVLGLILSWDGRYDEARQELNAVLAQTPNYLDARVALMNIEWWSGNVKQARLIVNAILTRDPGHTQARLVQQRLDAKTRPWSFAAGYTRDTFDDDRQPWEERTLSIGRQTPVGSIIVRGSQANRFGYQDQQVDVDLYPSFRAGTYAFVGLGFGVDQVLYPERRLSVDLYQSLGRGFEASAGFRRLQFSETTDIYVATLTKYLGNWMYTGKVFTVPDPALGNSWSYHGNARRYFGAAGTSFVGIGYSHGYSREEPRGSGDLVRVNGDTIRTRADIDLSEFLAISMSGSSSRQERAFREPLWQTTFGGGLTFRF